MRKFTKKLRAVWRRRELDRDLDDELRFHIEMKADEIGSQQEAQQRLGNVTAFKEACRDLWTFSSLESCWQDVRYACRMVAKTPGFTLIAVLALGLGIGADTAVFTIVNGAFSWNLGLEHLDRTVLVGLTNVTRGQDFGISYADFRDLRSRTKALAGLAAYQMTSVNLSDTKALPERYWCVKMSANGFSVSEQKPVLGRAFVPDDDRVGATPVAVLTYHIWQDRYGKDPHILGRTIRVNDVPRIIVGVMPPSKRFPEETDLWTPLVPDTQMEDRSNRNIALFGRLADEATLAGARADLSIIAGRLAEKYPITNKGLTVSVQPIAVVTGVYNMRPLFVALWAAIGFVLLIACADVANMLLARGAGRTREISVRIAIGAGRIRILRQLLIESVILSAAGGFLGWLVAAAGLRWFDAGIDSGMKPVWLHLSLDGMAFTYLAAISIGAGILFGLAPALRLARLDVHNAMKDGGHGVAGGRRVLSVSNLLVVAEMALCLVLLAGAGLMIRSTINLYNAPIEVTPANVLTMRINLPEEKYASPEKQIAFHRTLKMRLESLPGVEAAAIASNLPFGRSMRFSYELEGGVPEPNRTPEIGGIVATSAYFQVMHVKPRRGRTFADSDTVGGADVVMVNQNFVEKHWPGENAIGKRIRLVKGRTKQAWLTILGVLPNIPQGRSLEQDPLIYLPFSAEPQREMYIVARTHVPPATLEDAFRRTVQSLDADLPVYEVRTLESWLAQNRLASNVLAGMFSVFAATALILASIGLYAVISNSISQRTQEIGVRIAIGGTSGDILRLVYVQGMRPLAIGIAIGLPAALGVTHILRMALIGVSTSDPATFLIVVFVLLLAGILGCAIPAHRAIRVDPIVALRYE